MKELTFYYMLRIRFSAPVTNHRFTVRCVPQDNDCQKIRALNVRILPRESLSYSRDSFGNYCIFGHCNEPHDLFLAEAKGEAVTGLREAQYGGPEHLAGRFRYQTDYTRPGKNLAEFFRDFTFREGSANLEKARLMMKALYECFSYVPGATDFETTAEEAFSLGKGVCQDYAHILLSLCRMAGIPARYVVGMLLGEGASHAWVEIYDSEYWYALDPTNPGTAEEDHIKISSGRDYADCVINQGIMAGQARQTQEVEVRVEPL